MAAYLDSGVLLKLYLVEPGSREVCTLVQGTDSMLLCSLQLTEMQTALRAAGGRGQLDERLVADILKLVDEDIQAGLYRMIYPDWEDVFATTRELSSSYTSEILCRTLDILHVAVAASEGVSLFLTGDKRQSALARKAGLPVRLISP